jgi:nucleotide-binding universal stress UspA family protein
MTYTKILLALSCGDDESRVITAAVHLARQLDATLGVIHVNEPHAGEPSMMMDSPPKIEEAEIRELLQQAGVAAEAEGAPIDIVEDESYSEAIGRATADADLLVIGHSHRNRFLEALVESLDEEVANTSRCPVLVVPKGR